MTQSCITPAHKVLEPGAHCTACGSSTGCRVSFPDASTGLTLPGSQCVSVIQAAQRGFCNLAPLKETCLLLLTLAGKGLVNLVSLRDFLKLLWVISSVYRAFP